MTVIFCDKCKKELKDSDNYWKAWNRKRPFLDDIFICAACMREFLKEEKEPKGSSSPEVKKSRGNKQVELI